MESDLNPTQTKKKILFLGNEKAIKGISDLLINLLKATSFSRLVSSGL